MFYKPVKMSLNACKDINKVILTNVEFAFDMSKPSSAIETYYSRKYMCLIIHFNLNQTAFHIFLKLFI